MIGNNLYFLPFNPIGVDLQGTAKMKVPGGKMLSVKLEYRERIEKVEILGDFFLHPESAIGEVEASLVGADINESIESLSRRIDETISRNNAELIGATPNVIAEAILKAVGR